MLFKFIFNVIMNLINYLAINLFLIINL